MKYSYIIAALVAVGIAVAVATIPGSADPENQTAATTAAPSSATPGTTLVSAGTMTMGGSGNALPILVFSPVSKKRSKTLPRSRWSS